MVSDQIIDKRSKMDQGLFPWWWRQPDAVKRAGGKPMINPAYLYELGRRHLIREQNHSSADCPPVPKLLSRCKIKKGELEFQLMHHFELEAIDPTVLIDPCAEKMPKNEFEHFAERMPGHWNRTHVFAWNLEAPWSKIEKTLKEHFKDQQSQIGIKSRSKAREIQAPHWQNLEIWDCWAANQDIPERFLGGAPDHLRKVWTVTRDAKPLGQKALTLISALRKILQGPSPT